MKIKNVFNLLKKTSYRSTLNNINITINTEEDIKNISPYIYGINYDFLNNEGTIPSVATACRLGGNRFTGYNWENNASNAGKDWMHYSDNYLTMNIPESEENIPGKVVTNFKEHCITNNIPYSFVTVQMAGYVSKDKDGIVTEEETAPSSRWVKTINRNSEEYSSSPDLNDDYVYMDEFINFLLNKYGDASTINGIKGYCLDNEPGLWAETHPRIHPEKVKCSELIEKSTDTAKMIKDLDNSAETFGPILYGMTAYESLQEAPDWSEVKGDYDWFVDYYLDEMKKASDNDNRRLLDVFAFNYYSEATGGGSRVVFGSDITNIECNKARIQAPRTLWDSSYVEDSWIGKYRKEFIPIIPKMKSSIEKYYPDTKLSILEYNFGGADHISGGIAQADSFGIFANEGVYLTSYWPLSGDTNYIQAAYNLYRNYDGKKSTYGDIHVKSDTSDIENSSVYASLDSTDDSKLHIILINKNYDSDITIDVNLEGSGIYTSGKVWAFDENSSDIKELPEINNIDSNKFSYSIPKLTACHIVLNRVNSIIDTTDFVVTDGNKFKINDENFYFAGTNNYYLTFAPNAMVDDVFNSAKSMGLKVMRTWGFIDGESKSDVVMQPSLGVYDEDGFKKFDYVVKKASDYGIKLIVPFVNNWDEFGGMNQYIKWVGASKHDDFYTNSQCKEAFKKYIKHFLTRVNTYTGKQYMYDSTIMAFELANEPRCQSDPSGDTIYNWTKEISEFIKSIDKNHLVSIGDEGFFNRDSSDWNYSGGEGVDFDRLMTIDTIDFGTFHLYPDGWNRSVEWGTTWIVDHINAGKALNKPVVLEEFGVKSNKDEVYKLWGDTVVNNDGAGLMSWILTGIGYDGNLYPDYDGFRIVYPSSTATVLSETAAKLNEKSINTSILGDVNNDGAINVLDYLVMQKYVLGKTESIDLTRGDLNKDNKVNSSDLLLLRKFLVKIISKFN
ncbi:Endo-beta-mannanase [Clostridium bornimense]|uniref:mannan endo-1,4-beta-mannosidase n=1 Tax=Clostridium bornimense TaxID=1216932 RepID=W6S145_9CLOT|nr:glycoside hydrolase family 44 protein [Clostridium bornimense]CDM70443.1 Endo-beta-mannanase [Clostridium bornimense]